MKIDIQVDFDTNRSPTFGINTWLTILRTGLENDPRVADYRIAALDAEADVLSGLDVLQTPVRPSNDTQPIEYVPTGKGGSMAITSTGYGGHFTEQIVDHVRALQMGGADTTGVKMTRMFIFYEGHSDDEDPDRTRQYGIFADANNADEPASDVIRKMVLMTHFGINTQLEEDEYVEIHVYDQDPDTELEDDEDFESRVILCSRKLLDDEVEVFQQTRTLVDDDEIERKLFGKE